VLLIVAAEEPPEKKLPLVVEAILLVPCRALRPTSRMRREVWVLLATYGLFGSTKPGNDGFACERMASSRGHSITGGPRSSGSGSAAVRGLLGWLQKDSPVAFMGSAPPEAPRWRSACGLRHGR